ncbi:MAG: hypothetical protein D6737_05850 [Chloroflexi bacterium]|nr:MAG: hypothetical protein D6737_05850 [Chloroflexota bacterium]
MDGTKIRLVNWIPPFSDPIFKRKFLWSLIAVVLAGIVHTGGVIVLIDRFPNPVRPSDLILDAIDRNLMWVQVSNIVIVTQVALTFYGLSRVRYQHGPRLIFLLAMMYVIRGVTIILTPLAQTAPPELSFGDQSIISKYMFQGMFFSGHTGSAFIQAAMMPSRRLRQVQYGLSIVQVTALLLSHSHYSIDIWGGLFVAYFLLNFNFMRLVPPSLRRAKWAPWYSDEIINNYSPQSIPEQVTV